MKRTLLGMLTPSSNTVLEPMTQYLLKDSKDISAHFGRFEVTEISLADTALKQFDISPILEASRLLSHAKVQSIVWNGTSSGWLGFQTDVKLCNEIEKHTGIKAGTSVLALNKIMELKNIKKFGLVTPYLHDVQDKILKNYRSEGFECVAETHFNDRGNFSFSEYTEEQIKESVRSVAQSKPEAITIFCTNMRGAAIVRDLEQELGIPIYDSVSTAIWVGMRLAGDDPSRIKDCGSIFQVA